MCYMGVCKYCTQMIVFSSFCCAYQKAMAQLLCMLSSFYVHGVALISHLEIISRSLVECNVAYYSSQLWYFSIFYVDGDCMF